MFNSFKLATFLICFTSKIVDSQNGLIITDENNTIYFVKVNNHNKVESILKLFQSETHISSVAYNPQTNIIVWCERDIKYGELNYPLETRTLLTWDECNAITYDWHNNVIYYYSKVAEKIMQLNYSINTTLQVNIHSIIKTPNVLSLKYDPFTHILFWIEQNMTTGTNQLTQLTIVANKNEYLPKTINYDNDFGYPRIFDINYITQEIYVVTQEGYFLILDYNGEEIFSMSSSLHFSDALMSISYCNQHIYFLDSFHESISAFDINENMRYLTILFEFNSNVASILCVKVFRKLTKNDILLNRSKKMDKIKSTAGEIKFTPVLKNSKESDTKTTTLISRITIFTAPTYPLTTTPYIPTNISNKTENIRYEKLNLTYSHKDEKLSTSFRAPHTEVTTFSVNKPEEAPNKLINYSFVTPTQPTEVFEHKYIILLIILMITFGFIATILVVMFYQKSIRNTLNDKRNKRLNKTPLKGLRSDCEIPSEQNVENDEQMRFIKDESLVLDFRNLIYDENTVLASGNFGIVFRGTLNFPYMCCVENVVIKTLNRVMASEQLKKGFLEEGFRMKDFNHPNVLRLIGICFNGNKPLIVMPYMENGDMLTYIRSKSSLTNETLLGFAAQVANGMVYLSHQKIVHIDLAARNCMLDQNLDVKIADFGLSRDIYLTGNYKTYSGGPFPYKWMAIECLEALMEIRKAKVFNNKTDVWSFGVLMWELITHGEEPYGNHINDHQLLCKLKSEQRLPQPNNCPETVFVLMRKCWDKNPIFRPLFEEVLNELKVNKFYIEWEKQNKFSKMKKPLKKGLNISLQH